MPHPTTGFRAATHDDAHLASALANLADPNHPQLAEELLDMWVNTEKGATVRRFVVQRGGGDVGWISLVQPNNAGAGVTYLNLLIPASEKLLIPDAVAFAEDQARQMGARLLICQLGEDRVEAVEWLRGTGWNQERKERYWRLDLGSNADRIHRLSEAAQHRMGSAGVAITTVADLGGESFLPRLHPVAEAASADIPRSVEYVPQTYEEWVVWLQPPYVLPGRIWVAVVDGEPVGQSFLVYRPSVVETGFTGVLREHRGKGVARALKLATLVQAIDLGVTTVETDNDSENAPILHLNEEIGYAEIPGRIEFHRKLSQ